MLKINMQSCIEEGGERKGACSYREERGKVRGGQRREERGICGKAQRSKNSD